ncbi:hypothetical protein OROHE_000671 [Orobanche hederae]
MLDVPSNVVQKKRVAWTRPPSTWSKINFDAGFDGTAFAAAVYRNDKGTIIQARTDLGYAPDAFTAEAKAGMLAIDMAVDLKLEKVIFEGDARNVICSLKGGQDAVEWRARPVTEACKNKMTGKHLWKMVSIARNCNVAAHRLAIWAKENGRIGIIPTCKIPLQVLCDLGSNASSCSDQRNCDLCNDFQVNAFD